MLLSWNQILLLFCCVCGWQHWGKKKWNRRRTSWRKTKKKWVSSASGSHAKAPKRRSPKSRKTTISSTTWSHTSQRANPPSKVTRRWWAVKFPPSINVEVSVVRRGHRSRSQNATPIMCKWFLWIRVAWVVGWTTPAALLLAQRTPPTKRALRRTFCLRIRVSFLLKRIIHELVPRAPTSTNTASTPTKTKTVENVRTSTTVTIITTMSLCTSTRRYSKERCSRNLPTEAFPRQQKSNPRYLSRCTPISSEWMIHSLLQSHTNPIGQIWKKSPLK